MSAARDPPRTHDKGSAPSANRPCLQAAELYVNPRRWQIIASITHSNH